MDEVFIIGDNDREYLGFSSSPSPMEPILIPELCNKEIKGIMFSNAVFQIIMVMMIVIIKLFVGFAFGNGPHILAFNEQGQVFGWGYNAYGQAGIVSETAVTVPTMISSLSTKQIIQVACGSHHSLALCSDGKVRFNNSNGQHLLSALS